MLKIFSPEAHGVLDYVTAASLLVLPELLDLPEDSQEASTILRASGAGILAQALLTDYGLGVAKLLPFRVHLGNDLVLGLALAASPFLFRFRDEKRAKTWLPHLVIGLYALVTTLLTYRKDS
jgi:hypothetical protein